MQLPKYDTNVFSLKSVNGLELCPGKPPKLLAALGTKDQLRQVPYTHEYDIEEATPCSWNRPYARAEFAPSPELHIKPTMLQPGYQIRNRAGSTGTCGPLVANKEGNVGFLTNWHVMARNREDDKPEAWFGKNIGYPAVGEVGHYVYNMSADACVVWFNHYVNDYDRANRPAKHRWMKIHKVAIPAPGELVYKVGRTTGLTAGIVQGFAAIKMIGIDNTPVILDTFLITPATPSDIPLSEGGDSGAGWWVVRDNEPYWVGLHVAGEGLFGYSERAYACYMRLVLDHLNVEIL